MGCSCLGATIKIKSNISVINQIYTQVENKKEIEDKEVKDIQNISKILKLKVKSECSNISSSDICFSDDSREDDKKENIKNSKDDDESENDMNNSENDDVNKPIIIIV